MQWSRNNIDKRFCTAAFFILALYFIWSFYSNFYFSDNYDLLALRDVDDTNFHKVLETQRSYIRMGQWGKFWSMTTFGYGVFFWNPIALITYPFSGADHPLLVFTTVLPRQLSLSAFAFSLWAFFRIGRKLALESTILCGGLLLICTWAASSWNVGFFHNHCLVTALTLWSLYFLLEPRRRVGWAGILFGGALGIKLSALVMAPYFLVLLFWPQISRRETGQGSCIKNFKVLAMVVGTALFVFSPPVFIYPLRPEFFNESLFLLKSTLVRLKQEAAPTMPYSLFLKQHFFAFFYNYWVVLIGVLGGVYILLLRVSSAANKIFLLFSFLALAEVLFMARWVTNTLALITYGLPLMFLWTYSYLQIAQSFPCSRLFLSALVGLNLFFNFPTFSHWLFKYHNDWTSPAVQNRIVRYHLLKPEMPVEIKDRYFVLTEYPLALPLGLMRNMNQIDQKQGYPDGVDVYRYLAIDKRIPEWVKPCEELYPAESSERLQCQSFRAYVRSSHVRPLLEDSELLVVEQRR